MARILLIEDDLELLDVLTALLTSESHEVTGVSSGGKALLAAAKTSFDLVVADIRMEGMSGLDAIERVQQDDKNVKSLVITGYASEEDSIRAISLGVEAYLKKPFSLDELLDAVNRALQDLDSERAAQSQRMELTASFQWALTALSRMVEQTPQSPPLSRLAPLVQSMCQNLGVVDAVRSSAVVTSLYLGVREALSSLVLDEAPRFPRAIERALDALDEWFDGSGQPAGLEGENLPLETRIAQVAYAAVCEVPAGEDPIGWLASHHAGRYDPSIVALLKEPLTQPGEGYREQLHAQRSLLSLGKAFEEAGNYASARQAFSQVLEHQTNRFAMEASLGLARLAAQGGKEPPGRVKEQIQRTIRMAECVGAAPFGWCGIELACLAFDVGFPDDAHALLDRSKRAFGSLKLTVGEGAVYLTEHALFGRGEAHVIVSALEPLLRGSFAERVAPLVRRLLPSLLDSAAAGKMSQLADRLVRDFPRQIIECLCDRSLSSSAKLRIAQVHSKYILPHRAAILGRLAMDSQAEVRELVADLLASESGTQALPVLRVFSLGPLSVFKGDQRVQETQWRSQKTKYLLAMLAAAGGGAVSEDKILESFWPASARKGKNCLYWSTSALRQCLKTEGFDLDPIVRTSSGLQLNPDLPRWHDFDLFEKLAESVRTGSTNAYNIEEYLHVLDLYRGPYLEGAYFDWAVAERHRLEIQASTLLTRFIDWTLQKQRFSNTLDYALRLLEIDPSESGAHLAVMKAWLGLGKPKDALDQFDRAEKLLRREYDAEPSIAMLEYRQRALIALDHRQEPHLSIG